MVEDKTSHKNQDSGMNRTTQNKLNIHHLAQQTRLYFLPMPGKEQATLASVETAECLRSTLLSQRLNKVNSLLY